MSEVIHSLRGEVPTVNRNELQMDVLAVYEFRQGCAKTDKYREAGT